ncbi:YciI family protein [Streptomyces sp. NPDC056909]|uniref:YciI family protein n=1 Tax=unclassified Streptomyces TaxID=2593676 RepID=UPI003412C5AC|nr:YciI family protein [Streptomyces sp. NBC_00872]
MAKFVVEFEYNVDRAGRQHLHPAHAENLYSLADRGVLLLAGPLVDENAGLLVYEVGDREELQKILDDEPYVKGGIVARTRIQQWAPGKGSWITALDRSERDSGREGTH